MTENARNSRKSGIWHWARRKGLFIGKSYQKGPVSMPEIEIGAVISYQIATDFIKSTNHLGEYGATTTSSIRVEISTSKYFPN